MPGTYCTNLRHFLDDKGEIIDTPLPARKLACFLALIVDRATSAESVTSHDTGMRCRKRSCRGSILSRWIEDTDEIRWHCPACGHHGLIVNWQGTKWDRSDTHG